MAPIAMVTGFALIVLGVGGYGAAFALPDEKASPTALIPAAFGVLILILGILSRQEKMRMHAMHGAALLGLVGLVIPLINVIRKVAAGTAQLNLALTANLLMAVICGIFLALCVRSFIAARRQRKQQAGP